MSRIRFFVEGRDYPREPWFRLPLSSLGYDTKIEAEAALANQTWMQMLYPPRKLRVARRAAINLPRPR